MLETDLPDVLVEMADHTDARGSETYNLNLSRVRGNE